MADPADLILGHESYFQYATGVAIINNPIELAPMFSERSDPDEILVHAERLMFDGLKGVIRYASSDEDRSHLAKLEKCFDKAVEPMNIIVQSAYEIMGERLRDLNPMLQIIRPNPVLDRIVYGYVCHGRLNNIRTERLLGGMMPSVVFNELLSPSRTLSAIRGVSSNLARNV